MARKPAVVFTFLALGFACLYWVLIFLAEHRALPFAMGHFDFSLENNSVPGVILACLLRIFGPAVAAILTLAWLRGRPGLKELWQSVARWRSPPWLYALAFFAPLVVSALIVAIAYPMGLLHYAPDQVHPLRFIVFFLLMFFLDGPLGEEVGWRGLLLPELLKTMGPLKASFVVGVIWYLWHIPLYLADDATFHPLGFFINVVGISYIFTWFYLKSSRSTFMTTFLHTTTNFALFLVLKSFTHPDDITLLQYIYDAIVLVVAAAAAYAMFKDKRAAPG